MNQIERVKMLVPLHMYYVEQEKHWQDELNKLLYENNHIDQDKYFIDCAKHYLVKACSRVDFFNQCLKDEGVTFIENLGTNNPNGRYKVTVLTVDDYKTLFIE